MRPFAVLDDLRRQYFPAALNRVPAHVSLFHALPGGEIDAIAKTLAGLCARTPRFELWPEAPVSLGRGVAVRYRSEALAQVHAELSRHWAAWLTPQDRQRFKAHVTIQNKVTPAEVRVLLHSLDFGAIPVCRVEGLRLWRYRGGPWDRVDRFAFAGGV